MTASIDWYFDFVSPYAYLGLHRLKEVKHRIRYRPVLFAGLLKHWGQKGPAEIPAKRKWTYRSCDWQARKLGLPFRFPAAHPFNPLPHLRLALACDSRPDAIARIFEHVWTTGEDATDPQRFAALCRDLAIDPERLGADDLKAALKANTDDAIRHEIFGVPSFLIDGQVFWGADAQDFALAFLADPSILKTPETRRLDTLPVAASRRS